jgi:aspartyl-tRNA(Asn)/glutamyl-tRNA(Gln) amidotransferase subunit B
MEQYKMTIGLEIHAELKTQSKMFCGCINSGEEKLPNIYICPVCMGHPGTLPVINKEAVKKVLLVGTALDSQIADFTEFDRKNYFYPDIPKGYQISQYKNPLVSGGSLVGVEITRIHLEEDTARSTHPEGKSGMTSYGAGDTHSLVDYNRAGVPLMELVTEPVIHSSDEATKFAKELQLLLQYLGVSDANMEKGEMRVEVNISVSKTDMFGTKVEVKNINSFRAVGKAIDFEFDRQVALLENGNRVVQETRGWDENKEITFSQRLKESAHDYRYFEDPDLPKLMISEIPEFAPEELRKLLVELPGDKRKRLMDNFGLKLEDTEIYVGNREIGEFFESAANDLFAQGVEVIKTASNYITSDIIGLSKFLKKDFTLGKITKDNFVKLINMINKKDLSSRGAKDILKIMFEAGGDPEVIANEKGLVQKSNAEEIKLIAEKILNENQKVVEEYKNGKESLLQFFMGQGMKETKGSVNPEMLKKIILELLKK